jgi:hypothetical protein
MCALLAPYYPADPLLDDCLDNSGDPAESWIGSGAATCAETLSCMAKARPIDEDGGNDFFGCVVDSCPGVSAEISEVLRCKMSDGRGECETECETDAESCDACVTAACSAPVDACQAASCG